MLYLNKNPKMYSYLIYKCIYFQLLYHYIYSESRLHRHGCVSSKNVDIGGLSILVIGS